MIDASIASSSRQATREPAPAMATGRLAIFMLSSFRIDIDGQPVQRSLGTKGRPLLKILAAQRRHTVTRDALIEMLWPGSESAAGATSLKVAAHNLRRLLEPDKPAGAPGSWIWFRYGTYQLNPEAEIWIDVECMEQRAREGRRFELSGDLARARSEYAAAEALYTGDFLEEDIYEDWTIIRREQLRDTYLDLLGRLAYLSRNQGDHAAVIRYCHKIIDADPCREDAYRLLMQAHGALGQHARAGAWYAVCRTMLQREIGTAPAPDTIDVFESLFASGDRTLTRL